MLEVVDVAKSYEQPGGGGSIGVLRGITLKVREGESVAIAGPSGSGKSTLLNIIGGLDYPTSGQVLLGGKDLAEMDDKMLAGVRNREIGFVFQLHHLLPQCTVLENVLIPTLVGVSSEAREQTEARAVGLLERVGLGEHLSHRPGELSGGQRQRVAVVRALINRPKLLLADEPTGSLDKNAAAKIAELLVELNRSERVSLVVVTHSMKLAQRMGRVWELSEGVLRDGRESQ
jgi:ABC-type lipoprotein export system ATPase subunit